MKQCTGCKESKPLDRFYFDKRKSAPRPQCKSCTSERSARYYRENSERVIARTINTGRQRKYGISTEQFEEMLVGQSGLCSICREAMKPPCIDHDHDTGKARQLLCSNCNAGLGQFRDNPKLLDRAASYLREHGK
ncbi:endonuclease VII domain-containing protein [Micromonospora sp. CB01531]|uniref:endonuclease VII domain-containing protein n=1 Tax=Micromonospora sp. CB01531 TaxID=1718947 RepID=UPI00093D46C1|nr:endonuclease VII domain-containing protein [Micromonospora sp. CB01531]